jgi:hypothetical protein
MTSQLLPPPELAPPVPPGLPSEQYISMWFDLLETCEQFLLAGLREQIGPGGDLQAAYVDWYWKQMEEHDRTMLHMMAEFERRYRSDGC